MPAFIETQFPIARLSAESYKERKATNSQTLTGLGRWWGRKPLILVRASILGMLMPASNDAKKDREIFLQILTIDDAGAIQRWKPEERFGQSELMSVASPLQRERWDELDRRVDAALQNQLALRTTAKQSPKDDAQAKAVAQLAAKAADREALEAEQARQELMTELQVCAFQSLSYAERLTRCERPENVEGPSEAAWVDINVHLGTTATNLSELIEQLGQRTFGHTPRVGDSFCGGGSIPFEAARIGCEAFGSDLNPVAGLLTWASLNLLGGGAAVQKELRRVQSVVFAAADQQITDWGIEHNSRGERAEAFLYCVEVKPEGCNYYIPLAPSWLVGESTKAIIQWHRENGSVQLRPEHITGSVDQVRQYKEKKGATVVDSRMIDPFDTNRSWSVEALRGPNGLRRWSNEDLVPRAGDVFQERLYCIRWVKTVIVNGKPKEVRRYAAPDAVDLAREEQVLTLLRERFTDWQQQGFIPSKAMAGDGDKTDEPIRTRGWTHWHHLFTPRQLLVNGLIAKIAVESARTVLERAAFLLGIGRLANWNARLCRWHVRGIAIDKGEDVFSNQALNTLFNFSCRPLPALKASWQLFNKINDVTVAKNSIVQTADARDLRQSRDLWITDPPYADAVNYHELSDFFLAWYDKQLTSTFPEWTPDARAELAVRGNGKDFRRSMVEIYKNLARHMPDNGLQMVMFTHQDPAVWADLGMILWAAGLKATAAWTISTETEAVGIKKGNYVQGTVCLVLRKRTANDPGFLDEVYPLVEDEVKRQIASMQALDEGGEPNFNDADYQLAAYAAALKVLTQYGNLNGKDVEHEVFAVRARGEKSDFQTVIERALGIACDTLIPRGLDNAWRDLSLVERYYLRSLDIESRGERRKCMYEELARGFGVQDIKPLLKSDKANGTRMFTPTGLAAAVLVAAQAGDTRATGQLGTNISRGRAAGPGGRAGAAGPHPFAASPLRHLMFAVRETAAADNSPEPGRQYLRDTFGQGYWGKREGFVNLLEWLAALGNAQGMNEWASDSEAARMLAGRLRNDHA
jgi:adenine-specific DNA methylase